MIRFQRIEISNFVCFESLLIEPSLDISRPMTIIRAENASGKTTFLRAVRWGMYGEQGLPGGARSFGVHPTFWQPDSEGVESRVVIEFTSDGSTRHDTTASGGETLYRLIRSVRTISRNEAPGYQRINETTQLMMQTLGGNWESHSLGVDHVIGQLLPWELRDFFVMDADEAAEFVGGSENMTISRSEVEKKTTYAINALLGIGVFREAAGRVEDARRSFGGKATKAVGDTGLDELQAELQETRLAVKELEAKHRTGERTLANVRDSLVQQRHQLASQLKGLGAHDELNERLKTNQRDLGLALRDYDRAVGDLAANLESPALLAKLGGRQVSDAVAFLKPMYDSGQIPQRHLGFVRQLLESGRCVCGVDLVAPGSHRSHVEQQLAESEGDAQHADYLGRLYEASTQLESLTQSTDWTQVAELARATLAEAESRLSTLGNEKQDIDDKLSKIDSSEISVTQNAIEAFEVQVARLRAENAGYENLLPEVKGRADALDKQIKARQKTEVAAAGHRRSEDLAEVVHRVLTTAYGMIQNDQVGELSSEMNRLFAAMVDNVTEEETTLSQAGKETIRTIAQVGVRPTADGAFEIFAINNHGWDKPHIEINGASRRVIALAFVLALCTESKTRAPLIADSLLKMMSGAVRRNTLSMTAERSGQPILLLTGADLEADSEVATVAERAGATYTLTAQWHGEVLHQTDSRAISLACPCAPRQFCDICEREGQAGRPGWTKRS